MAQNIKTSEGRDKLPARRPPYWDRLGPGQHLGFRKMDAANAGTWLARFRDSATTESQQTALGSFEDVPGKSRFDAAADAARQWFTHLGAGGKSTKDTVADVCASYVADLRRKGKASAADDAERRFKQYVLDNLMFAGIECSKLTSGQITAWRNRLQARPTPTGKHRSLSSLNRDITPFRAALNFAADNRIVTSGAAWAVTLRPIPKADKRRTIYPSREEVKAIIAVADPDLAEFLKALAMVPIRPGAMAALTVKDFNKSTSELTVPSDKTGENRTIKLPSTTAAHFATHCKGKLPAAQIFAKDGNAWSKDRWKLLFKVAAIAAGVHVVDKQPTAIDPAQRMSKVRSALKAGSKDTLVTIYGVRHSVITTLIETGLPVQTIAQLAGTSPRMIHSNYGHLTDRASVAALERISL